MNEEPLPISALEHWCYCPRQCALILVDGVWVDNEHTVRGHVGHRRADTASSRIERGRHVVRAVPLWSETLGLTGRADAVEIRPDGAVMPVEYKIGRRHGDAGDVQLCAQALCLEEMLGVVVRQGAIWYSATRRRHTVKIDETLRCRTRDVIAAVRHATQERLLPPAVDDERCRHCQLAAHCMPGTCADPERVRQHLDREVYRCR